ncbi:MAG: hypothetical protein GW949_02720 [Spirochaetales bacterium]|nr:hypothetical protein [Spirochaetales bacterium]
MKILVGFASKYGAAKGAAQTIAATLKEKGHHVQVFNLTTTPQPLADEWEAFIVGGSIYAGQINGKLRGWVEKNETLLATRPLGLFVTSLAAGEKALVYLESSYPPSLLAHAQAKGVTGGIADPEKMKWLDRFILKKVAKVSQTKDTRDPEALRVFIDSFLKALS